LKYENAFTNLHIEQLIFLFESKTSWFLPMASIKKYLLCNRVEKISIHIPATLFDVKYLYR